MVVVDGERSLELDEGGGCEGGGKGGWDGMDGWMAGCKDGGETTRHGQKPKKKAQARTKARHEEPAGLGLVLESGLTDGDGD